MYATAVATAVHYLVGARQGKLPKVLGRRIEAGKLVGAKLGNPDHTVASDLQSTRTGIGRRQLPLRDALRLSINLTDLVALRISEPHITRDHRAVSRKRSGTLLGAVSLARLYRGNTQVQPGIHGEKLSRNMP